MRPATCWRHVPGAPKARSCTTAKVSESYDRALTMCEHPVTPYPPRHPGDPNPPSMSVLQPPTTKLPQISCYITRTNKTTHKIISDNTHLSAMYSGEISGIGPRYCPSIEDKINKFSEKESHQIQWPQINGTNCKTGRILRPAFVFDCIICG